MPIYGKRNIRAFGVKGETTYGADMSGTDTLISLPYEGGPMEPVNWNYYKNDDEVHSSFLPLSGQIINRHIEHQHQMKLVPSIMGFVMGCIFDEYTTALASGESTIYKHSFKLLTHGLAASYGLRAFSSRNVHEVIGNVIRQYRGIVLNGITLSGDRGGFVKASADMLGLFAEGSSGKTHANLTSVLTAQPYLKYGDLQFQTGTYTYSTEAFGSPTSHHAKLLSFSCGIKKTADKQAQFGDQGGYVTGLVPLGYEATLTAKMELAAWADYQSDWAAGTQMAIKIPISGSTIPGASNNTKWQVNIIFPKAQIMSAPLSLEDEKHVRDVEFVILGNAVGADDQSEWCVVEVFDKTADYEA